MFKVPVIKVHCRFVSYNQFVINGFVWKYELWFCSALIRFSQNYRLRCRIWISPGSLKNQIQLYFVYTPLLKCFEYNCLFFSSQILLREDWSALYLTKSALIPSSSSRSTLLQQTAITTKTRTKPRIWTIIFCLVKKHNHNNQNMQFAKIFFSWKKQTIFQGLEFERGYEDHKGKIEKKKRNKNELKLAVS